MRRNQFGQEIGREVLGFSGAHAPTAETMFGSRCRLEALDADCHAEALHAAYAADREGRNWTYLSYGPFETAAAYRAWVEEIISDPQAFFFAIVDEARGVPLGVASYLRIFPETGSIEVGNLSYAPALQRTPISTEAMYLMMRRAFEDWGYRRYEWKCDSLNEPSRRAAERLGFRYEGVFRNHLVMKGRNRDTAWFSITQEEWPGVRDALETWLVADNFETEGGNQIRSLASLMPASAGRPIVSDVLAE